MLTVCGIRYMGVMVRNGNLWPWSLRLSSLVVVGVVNYRVLLKCDGSIFGIYRITLPSRA